MASLYMSRYNINSKVVKKNGLKRPEKQRKIFPLVREGEGGGGLSPLPRTNFVKIFDFFKGKKFFLPKLFLMMPEALRK